MVVSGLSLVLGLAGLATFASARPVTTAGHAAMGETGARLTAAVASAGTARAFTLTTGGVLRPGARGHRVLVLQQRLAALKYYPGRVDGRFGLNTLEAVWAFQETQGLPGRNYVSDTMERALANPRPPKVLVHRR